jgi:hypothetical protein
VVYDLHYYCTVCNIESVTPGPCVCCQDEVELKERPLRNRARDAEQHGATRPTK